MENEQEIQKQMLEDFEQIDDENKQYGYTLNTATRCEKKATEYLDELQRKGHSAEITRSVEIIVKSGRFKAEDTCVREYAVFDLRERHIRINYRVVCAEFARELNRTFSVELEVRVSSAASVNCNRAAKRIIDAMRMLTDNQKSETDKLINRLNAQLENSESRIHELEKQIRKIQRTNSR